VFGSFFASDNTCEICADGHRSRGPTWSTSATAAPSPSTRASRSPTAPRRHTASPGPGLIPSLLPASDLLGTCWFGADAADVRPGKTVAVALAARQLAAERIIATSRHQPRQKLALEFGATDIVTECGDEGVARIKDMTGGFCAHPVIEAVVNQQSMMQAIGAAQPGGHVGYVGVSHGVQLPGEQLFYAVIRQVEDRTIDPGKVFDLTLPLDQAAEGYRAMDERTAIKPCPASDRHLLERAAAIWGRGPLWQ